MRSALLDAIDAAAFLCDDDGTVREWNRAAAAARGRSDGAPASLTLADLFDVADGGSVADAVAGALDSGEATVDASLVSADGLPRPVELTVRAPADGDALVAIGRDVTERTPADADYSAVLDRMSDGFLAVDADWRITHVNETATRILAPAMGRDPPVDDLTGLHLWEEIPDAVGTPFYDNYHEALETQEVVTFEEYYSPLETWFDVRAYPSETGLSIFFRDVTARRTQREALERRERVLRTMHDVIADRQRPFSEQVTALLDLGRTELEMDYGTLSHIDGDDYVFEIVDAADDRIQPGDVVPLSATNCEIAASTEETLVLGDVARDAPEETDRAGYAEWGISCYIGAPVFVEDGVYGTFCFYDTEPRDEPFSEWAVTLVDLMARWVGYELQRQEANRELARKNEALERFASVVSHDLRNPLAVLEGRLELAEQTGDPDQFDVCYDAIDRMYTLIDDLLSLARAGDVVDSLSDVELAALVDRCWESVSTADATLHVDTDRTVRGDEGRLRQLFENLFRNAVEHGSPGGTETDDGSGVRITVGDLPDGFYVADDGPGIPPEHRDDVFESGYSTTPDGTGFGLAIVDEIARAHDWSVRVVESDAGGARFEFTGVADAT